MPKALVAPFTDIGPHLAALDDRLAPLIARVGPCTLRVNPHAFRVLASSIISQQISTKAADSIERKVLKLCGRAGLRPGRVAELTDDELRSAGLSAGKVQFMRSLSRFFLDNPSTVRRLRHMTDEEVIEALVPIRGIGVWTAQMFLIFSLGRPDVLPTADLGFRAGVKDIYGLTELPDAKYLDALAEPWRPFRTIATWYFWKSRGIVPESR